MRRMNYHLVNWMNFHLLHGLIYWQHLVIEYIKKQRYSLSSLQFRCRYCRNKKNYKNKDDIVFRLSFLQGDGLLERCHPLVGEHNIVRGKDLRFLAHVGQLEGQAGACSLQQVVVFLQKTKQLICTNKKANMLQENLTFFMYFLHLKVPKCEVLISWIPMIFIPYFGAGIKIKTFYRWVRYGSFCFCFSPKVTYL
jgi:hypothetical protein